jgi:hypothetical protein
MSFVLTIFVAYQLKQTTMKIDIEPIIEKADKFDRTCIDMREIEALYVVRLTNGKNYTVKWDKKEMDSFLPNRTVSEMLKSWEETILRRHSEAIEAVESGLHPTRTFERPIMVKTPSGFEYPSKVTERVRSVLDTYEKNHFRFVAKQLEKEFGKLSFIKIV